MSRLSRVLVSFLGFRAEWVPNREESPAGDLEPWQKDMPMGKPNHDTPSPLSLKSCSIIYPLESVPILVYRTCSGQPRT